MLNVSSLDKFVEVLRAYDKWRLSSKTSILGILNVLGIQLLIGLIIALAIRLTFGLPNNAVVNIITFGFAIGGAISGPIVMLVWSTLFFNFAGFILGLIFGVWINLPSWWYSAASQWASGTSIPLPIFLSLVGALILWVAASKGFSIGWGILSMKLFESLRMRVKEEKAKRYEDVRSSAAKSVLPSEDETRRAIAAIDSAGEDGIILRAQSFSGRLLEPKKPSAALTDDDRISIYDSFAASSDDPLLMGLHKEFPEGEKILLDKADSNSIEPSSNDTIGSKERTIPDPATVKTPTSKDREQRRRRLEMMVSIFIDRIHSEGAEQDVMQDYVRKNASELKSFSAMDFEILNEIEGGAHLIEVSKNARGGMLFPDAVIDEKTENLEADQNEDAIFHFDSDENEGEGTSSEQSLLKTEALQEIMMGKRLTALLSHVKEANSKEILPDLDNKTISILISDDVSDNDDVGTSLSVMPYILPDTGIIESSSLFLGQDGKEESLKEIFGKDLLPSNLPFGGRFGESNSPDNSNRKSINEDLGDIITQSGTMAAKKGSNAGFLPDFKRKEEVIMPENLINIPVPVEQARKIFEILTTIFVAKEQIEKLKELDSQFEHSTNIVVLSDKFVEVLGDQASSQARTRFQHIREDYLSDPVKRFKSEIDNLLSRLMDIRMRPIEYHDHRIFLINNEIEDLFSRLMYHETVWTNEDINESYMELFNLLELCLVDYNKKPDEDSSRVVESKSFIVTTPLSKSDIKQTIEILDAIAPPRTEDPNRENELIPNHFEGRFKDSYALNRMRGEESKLAIKAEEILPGVSDAVSEDVAEGEIIDEEDYGFNDEQLDNFVPVMDESFPAGSRAWKIALAAYEQQVTDLEAARRQRKARIEREFRLMVLNDESANLNPILRSINLQVDEKVLARLAQLEKSEAKLNEEKDDLAIATTELEKDREAVRIKIEEAELKESEMCKERDTIERLREETLTLSNSKPEMNHLSEILLETAKFHFPSVSSLPEELRDTRLIELTAELDSIISVRRKVMSWSAPAKEERQKTMQAMGLDENSVKRLEPMSTAIYVLSAFRSEMARNIVDRFRDHFELPAEMSSIDVVQKIKEVYGDDQAIKKFVGNMDSFDDSRCNNLFAFTLEEQKLLNGYKKMPFSEFQQVSTTLEDLTKRAEEAEKKCTDLEESVKSVQSKNESLTLRLREYESNGYSSNTGHTRNLVIESADDIAKRMGINRSDFMIKGKLNLAIFMSKIEGCEAIDNYSAYKVGNKLFFYNTEYADKTVCVFNSEGEIIPVENAVRFIINSNPKIKNWFAVIPTFKLKLYTLLDSEMESRVIDEDFDVLVRVIADKE